MTLSVSVFVHFLLDMVAILPSSLDVPLSQRMSKEETGESPAFLDFEEVSLLLYCPKKDGLVLSPFYMPVSGKTDLI